MWEDLGSKHVKHVEFGHFSDLEHFKLFNKYAVQNADSLGMNEVELYTLIALWDDKLTDINSVQGSIDTIDEVLESTAELFGKARQMGLPLSRVHLHPYGSFLICYKKSIWDDARDAIIKSSIALPKYCLRS